MKCYFVILFRKSKICLLSKHSNNLLHSRTVRTVDVEETEVLIRTTAAVATAAIVAVPAIAAVVVAVNMVAAEATMVSAESAAREV